jgi:hypothetical protein
VDSDGTYCQAPSLKRGWELWLGSGWVVITSVRVSGEHVLIGAADGRTYRAGYLDAVRCRRVSPAAQPAHAAGRTLSSGSHPRQESSFSASRQPPEDHSGQVAPD